jgi:hypothetical protein
MNAWGICMLPAPGFCPDMLADMLADMLNVISGYLA